MTSLVVTVFLLVYLGMIFGGLPFLQLDRTGIALLGAIVLVASLVISVEEAYRSLHSPTLILLFAFMAISAQLRLGGFYPWIARRIGSLNTRPSILLGAIIGVAAYQALIRMQREVVPRIFANGFKPGIATYDGFKVPIPLAITIQHGDGDLVQVARDILGLTKLNYNSCQLGEGQPITVKYSDRVGEILLSNPGLPPDKWKHNFKYYA